MNHLSTWARYRFGPYLDHYLERHCRDWWADSALRYRPVVAALRSLGGEPSILEVGSGPLGITPFLRRPVVGVDLAFPWYGQELRPAVASALSLPFANLSFDAVVAVDALEHLAPPERAQAVREALRVARRLVVLAVPCGQGAARQDRDLDRLYEKLHGERYVFLREHVDQGLPSAGELTSVVREVAGQSGRRWRLRVEKNANLVLRGAFMRAWVRVRGQYWSPVEKMTLALMPLLGRLNWGDCYRQVLILRAEGQG